MQKKKLMGESKMAHDGNRPFMYGKLHRVTVTEANLNYVGSITIDPDLLIAAGIYPFTKVDVVNVTSGGRLQTYVIEGIKGKGEICLNGAAAHLFKKNDLAIIMAYEWVKTSELVGLTTKTVLVDEKNKLTKIIEYKVPALEDLGTNPSPFYHKTPEQL
jgi:aspartate 1-decarboxylase